MNLSLRRSILLLTLGILLGSFIGGSLGYTEGRKQQTLRCADILREATVLVERIGW